MAGRHAGSRKRGQRGSDAPDGGEIYLEYTTVGAQMRAVAIDAASGIEVTVFGPAKVLRDELGRLAVRKLQRRLASQDEKNDADRPAPNDTGTSRLV